MVEAAEQEQRTANGHASNRFTALDIDIRCPPPFPVWCLKFRPPVVPVTSICGHLSLRLALDWMKSFVNIVNDRAVFKWCCTWLKS